MDVRHGIRRADDARKIRHVGDLVERSVLLYMGHERFAGKHDPWNSHPTGTRNLPPIRVTTLQLHDSIISPQDRFR